MSWRRWQQESQKVKNFASAAHYLYIFFAVTVWLSLELKLPNFKLWVCKQYIYDKFFFLIKPGHFLETNSRKVCLRLTSEQVGIIILMWKKNVKSIIFKVMFLPLLPFWYLKLPAFIKALVRSVWVWLWQNKTIPAVSFPCLFCCLSKRKNLW